jgi:hypothetical protein
VGAATPINQTAPADLTLRYIERLPRLEYVVGSADPGTEGWPAPGSSVIWRGRLKNWSGRALAVDYAWSLDGARTASGSVDVPPRGEASVDFAWTWERRRRRLELMVDAANRATVPGGPRNRLAVDTDALGVALYVEQAIDDYFRRYQHELRIGNSSFEDWAQLQMQLWNMILEHAVFPETPQGVLDRVRIDAIHVVPDRALPLDSRAFTIGGSFDPTQARPNVADRSVDMQWGFPASLLAFGVFPDRTSLQPNNQFYYSGYLQHELGHARYLVDVYAWDVYDRTAGSRVEIEEGGARVAGSRYMPGASTIYNGTPGIQVHRTPHQGLMTSDWRSIDRYSAVALNLIAGRRALDGNYNEPGNLGAFLDDLPSQNRLALRDRAGRALAGAQLRVFRAAPGDASAAPYSKVFDATPDLELRADGQGNVLLGRNPFSATGRIVLGDPFANGTVIVRVEHEGRVGYGFLESSDFNLEYWRGRRELGEHALDLELF